MTFLTDWVISTVKLFHSAKDENLQWQTANQDQQIKLKTAYILAEKNLAAELKKKTVQLEHDIALLRTKNDAELSMFKTRCNQDIKDYKQYLAALDQLKRSIRHSYSHLPEAVAFTIHHHAKQLLNNLWEAEDFEQKMRHEMQLIQFMTTAHEDAQHYLEDGSREKLPEKTLNLIQNPETVDRDG